LKDVPIKNTIKTKTGKACIFVNNEHILETQNALKDTFNIEISNAKKNKILPKMKIFDIDTSIYKKDSKQLLVDQILAKNKQISETLNLDHDSILQVVMINEENKYAIVKVSENIRKIIKDNGNRIFLNLSTHYVKDNFHVIQCYKCQKYGHKIGSDHCSGKEACLYCSEKHRSSECKVKHQKENHKCSNCLTNQKYGSYDHKATSQKCPVLMNELESIIRRTSGISESDILDFMKKMKGKD